MIRYRMQVEVKYLKEVEKMKKTKSLKIISLILSFVFIFGSFVYADTSTVVTLGKDLDDGQKKQIMELFKVDEKNITVLEVNNQEERKYLEGIASEAQLGKLTLSSAYVELLEEGSGIEVETYNISWVTKEMYANALVTAGVENAKVVAAAPFPVSGTGALTGILKAFEEASGENIGEDQKKVANEEIVRVGELGEEVGQDKASELFRIVKERIIEKGIKDPEEIKKIIIEIAATLDINLSTDQIESIMGLMEKITKLGLNTETIKNQLKNIGDKLDDTLKNNEEVKSLLQKILDAIKNFFSSLFN